MGQDHPMSLTFKVEQSTYALQKMLIIELDGRETIRGFLNDQDAARVEEELKNLDLLDGAEPTILDGSFLDA